MGCKHDINSRWINGFTRTTSVSCDTYSIILPWEDVQLERRTSSISSNRLFSHPITFFA